MHSYSVLQGKFVSQDAKMLIRGKKNKFYKICGFSYQQKNKTACKVENSIVPVFI